MIKMRLNGLKSLTLSILGQNNIVLMHKWFFFKTQGTAQNDIILVSFTEKQL